MEITLFTHPTPQAESDAELLSLWLHGKSESTRRAYGRDVEQFLAAAAGGTPERGGPYKPLRNVRLADLQAWSDELAGNVSERYRRRKLAAVRSIFSFAMSIGYIHTNPAKMLSLPKPPQDLGQRIMSEGDTIRLIVSADKKRDLLLLSLLYETGMRAAEAAALKWRHLHARASGGQVEIHGKGGRTRYNRIRPRLWGQLLHWGSGAGPNDPVFPSRKGGGHLTPRSLGRIVERARASAGMGRHATPHWFRHAHASHALERGANIKEVKNNLGHASLATTDIYTHVRPGAGSESYLPEW